MENQNLTAEEKAALRKQRKAEKQNEKKGRINKATTTTENKPAQTAKGQGKRAKEIRLKSTFVNTTPKGEKKQFQEAMAAAYDPPAVEAAWYDWWQQCGYFKPSEENTEEKFVMVIPPPNVTGYLHMGHALTNAIQDSLTRWHRMSGRTTLWVPGTDHAGIATQTVVEKRIAKERGITRHDLGREAFVGEVYKWKDEYATQIVNQLKRIGSSLDWTREAFTMDQNFTKAVLTAFVKFYEDGLIYRENRLVNWSCTLRSTISDLEVDHITLDGKKKLKVPGYEKMIEFGELVKFAYKVNDSEKGEDDEIIVATTRIETMVGDTAIAIHSKDPRYTHLHGKTVRHPFRNENIPIICDDELVDMNFGTGAVKVTPAHDPNDYLCGKRNGLRFINILNDDGTFNENTGKYNKMKRYDVRYAILKDLDDLKLLRGRESHSMVLAKCSRSNDIIEPVLKPQWWVNCESLAKTALNAVENGDIQLIPENPHRGTWKHYLSNIQPWCISRQLWWGHRVPAYRIAFNDASKEPLPEEKSWVVAMSEEEAYKKAQELFPELKREDFQLKQDDDVLDTWFSSGLFPIGVFGWPDNTVDLQRFYPTSLLETGRDILFFWVMRMVMMCTHFTGQLPFKQVFLHSMVRDAHGEKMSKAKGNVIDPIDVIEGITLGELHEKLAHGNLSESEIAQAKAGQVRDFPKGISECGTDAMRFALCSYTSQGTDINLDIAKVVSIRNFCNKIWNAIKFGLGNLGEGYVAPPTIQLSGNERKEELWILSKLGNLVKLAEEGWRSYDFFKITEAISTFWVDELCSFYLESTKVVFQGDNDALKATTKATLYNCYEVGLRLLHPFMPFVTEELWQRLPRRPSDKASVMISPYPSPSDFNQFINDSLDVETKLIEEIIHHIRSMRASYNIPQKTLTETLIRVSDESLKQSILSFFPTIKVLSNANSLDFTEEPTRSGCSVKIISPQLSVLLNLQGIVDIAAEIKKLQNLLQGVEKSKEKLIATINNPLYSSTPENKQQDDKKKLVEMDLKIETTKAALASLA